MFLINLSVAYQNILIAATCYDWYHFGEIQVMKVEN